MAIFGLETPHLLVFAGVVLMVLEAIIPGGHFVVLGVALLLAGLLGTLVTPLATPIALAGLTLLFGAAALYVYREFDFYGSGSAGQTSDSSSLRGQTGRVVDRVTESEGRIKLDEGGFNPFYQARAFDDEIDVGEEVLVLDPGGGNVVTVTSLSELEEDGIDRELRREAERRAADGEESGAEGEEAGAEGGETGAEDEVGDEESEEVGDGEREAAGSEPADGGPDDGDDGSAREPAERDREPERET